MSCCSNPLLQEANVAQPGVKNLPSWTLCLKGVFSHSIKDHSCCCFIGLKILPLFVYNHLASLNVNCTSCRHLGFWEEFTVPDTQPSSASAATVLLFSPFLAKCESKSQRGGCVCPSWHSLTRTVASGPTFTAWTPSAASPASLYLSAGFSRRVKYQPLCECLCVLFQAPLAPVVSDSHPACQLDSSL